MTMRPVGTAFWLALGVVGLACAAPGTVLATQAPAPAGTAPPEIYHVITRPLCAELHQHIAPAVGMMLQNDTSIAKSPDLFKRYNRAAFDSVDNSASNADTMNGVPMTGGAADGTLNSEENMALLGMENLIRPIADNIIAAQKMLDSPALTNGTGNPDDDKRLQGIRAKLLKALAAQSASLDIISGFVDTQQMGDLQHQGEEYIAALDQPDTTRGTSTPQPANPLMADPHAAGLPANPYDINLATIPGLTLGYNPVTRLIDALHWTIEQTAVRENDAARSVMQAAAVCGS
jgi:hypothetical protein